MTALRPSRDDLWESILEGTWEAVKASWPYRTWPTPKVLVEAVQTARQKHQIKAPMASGKPWESEYCEDYWQQPPDVRARIDRELAVGILTLKRRIEQGGRGLGMNRVLLSMAERAQQRTKDRT